MKKSILLFITTLLMMTSAQAENINFKFNCEGPNLHYINQFFLQGNISISEEEFSLLDRQGLELSDINLEAQVTNAGYDTVENILVMNDLKGTLKKYEAGVLTTDVFYHLELMTSKDSDQFIYTRFNINYPGFLTSKIRVNNLKEYKAICKLVQN